jgi:hypothetical protein
MGANGQILRLACALSVWCVVGCTSWSETANDGSVTTHVIGYAKIRHPPPWCSGEPPQVSDVAHVGISLGAEGLLLGYGARTLVSFPPSEPGYLFVNVRNEEDLHRVIEILRQEQMKGYPLCLTINAIGASPEFSGTP